MILFTPDIFSSSPRGWSDNPTVAANVAPRSHSLQTRSFAVKPALFAVGLAVFGIVGCSGSKKTYSSAPTESVMEVSAPAPAPAPIPAPQPVVQPVVYDTMTTQPPVTTVASAGSHTVKKGDTLYGIARNRYGDGKQWTRIASANPGVRPETLKVGQTIVVP
jgi:nucleoid-associated protein YgaU